MIKKNICQIWRWILQADEWSRGRCKNVASNARYTGGLLASCTPLGTTDVWNCYAVDCCVGAWFHARSKFEQLKRLQVLKTKMVSRSFSCFEVWMPRLFKIRYPPPKKEREQHYCKKSFNLLNTSTPRNGSLSIGCGHVKASFPRHHASWKLRPGTNRSNNEIFELIIVDCGWVSTTEIWWINWISESIFTIFGLRKLIPWSISSFHLLEFCGSKTVSFWGWLKLPVQRFITHLWGMYFLMYFLLRFAWGKSIYPGGVGGLYRGLQPTLLGILPHAGTSTLSLDETNILSHPRFLAFFCRIF